MAVSPLPRTPITTGRSQSVPLKRPKTTTPPLYRASPELRIPALSGVVHENPYPTVYGHLHTLTIASRGSAVRTSQSAIEVIETALYPSEEVQCLDCFQVDLLPQVGETLGQMLEFKRQHHIRHNIQVLILDHNPRLGAKGVVPIFRALESDVVVTTLHMERVRMGATGALALAQALHSNHTLTRVNLAGNDIDAAGVEPLMQAVRINTTLTCLGLSFNKLGDAGVAVMAPALEEHTSLQDLEVAGCRISDKGFIALGLALTANTALLRLNVTENQLSESGLWAVTDLLEKNQVITQVHCPTMGHSAISRLKALLRRNRRHRENTEPRQLAQEVIRLHHQQQKLHVAQETLKGHQKMSVELDDKAQRLEADFNNTKQDIGKKSRDILSSIGYTDVMVHELIEKRASMLHEKQNDERKAEEQLQLQRMHCADAAKRAEQTEIECNEGIQKLEALQSHREQRKATLVARTEAARQETQMYREAAQRDREKLQKVQEAVKILEAQLDEQSLQKAMAAEKARIRRDQRKRSSVAYQRKERERHLSSFLGDLPA